MAADATLAPKSDAPLQTRRTIRQYYYLQRATFIGLQFTYLLGSDTVTSSLTPRIWTLVRLKRLKHLPATNYVNRPQHAKIACTHMHGVVCCPSPTSCALARLTTWWTFYDPWVVDLLMSWGGGGIKSLRYCDRDLDVHPYPPPLSNQLYPECPVIWTTIGLDPSTHISSST
ncbi:hypothetical protein J6590_018406 [Homalodisca vitripennis]|nr:hypothetical protein J6590_018406 [Homalodisca vitripennis]